MSTSKSDSNGRSSDADNQSPQRDNFRLIVENAPEILALIGAEGAIRFVNPLADASLVVRRWQRECTDSSMGAVIGAGA